MEEIDKLNGTNYGTWAKDVKAVLLDKNCWSFVIGTAIEPGKDASVKEKREFQARREKTYATIYLSITPEFRTLISDTEDGKIAWERLQKHFEPDSRARVIGLLDEFFECKLRESETIGLFAARLRNIVLQLSDCNHALPDLYQAFQLIRYLPTEYLAIVQAIYRWEDDKFKYDKVLAELLAEEARLTQSQKDNGNTTVFRVGINKNPTKPVVKQASVTRQSAIRCYKCNRKGHFASKCKSRNQSNSRNSRRGAFTQASYLTEVNCTSYNDDTWVFDTAATMHFCKNRSLFCNFKQVKNKNMSVAVDGLTCPIEGTGTIIMVFNIKGKSVEVTLNDVMYSPRLKRNLLAGCRFDKNGSRFVGQNGRITVYKETGEKIFTAVKVQGLYSVTPKYYKSGVNNNENKEYKGKYKIKAFTVSRNDDLETWHRRFAHINVDYIINTSKNNVVRGLPELKSKSDFNCEPCKLAKQRRVSFKSLNKVRSERPLELLHMDLCYMPKKSLNNHRYFLTITDDFSRKVTVFPIKDKTEVFSCFLRFQKRNERFLDTKILSVRTDNGLEFTHKEFEKFLEKEGIQAERTNAYTPEENGVSERFNYTAVDAIKTMLRDSNLGDRFWSEALLAFTYVWNRVCHGNREKTPIELFSGRAPSVKHLKIFGSKAYVGVPRNLRRKLDMRAKEGVMLGYALSTRGYRIWLPNEQKIIETINVSFDEMANKNEEAPQTVFRRSFDNQSTDSSSSEDESEGEASEKDVEPELPTQIKTLHTSLNWIRKPVLRKDKSRTDVYFYLEGSNERLRSHNDVKKFCNANNITFEENFFDFSGKNNYSGIVTGNQISSASQASDNESA